jgi:hypothetical protein
VVVAYIHEFLKCKWVKGVIASAPRMKTVC